MKITENIKNEKLTDLKLFNEEINGKQKWYLRAEGEYETNSEICYCFLQALFPQKCRLTSSKLHGEFPSATLGNRLCNFGYFYYTLNMLLLFS